MELRKVLPEFALSGHHLLTVDQHIMSKTTKFSLFHTIPVGHYFQFQVKWHLFDGSGGSVK
jgi:hypothetical protein